MMFDEADLLPLSALQHYVYCPRQCALIHVEQQWSENRFTAEGRAQHDRVDRPEHEVRDGVRLEYAVPLRSLRLGLIGKADVIEFHPAGKTQYFKSDISNLKSCEVGSEISNLKSREAGRVKLKELFKDQHAFIEAASPLYGIGVKLSE
jgi:CRISPR/Cas system-associated exonuclease Cas4 (RecB family)